MKKYISIILTAVFTVSSVTAAHAKLIGDTKNIVYRVTFDNEDEKYILENGAELTVDGYTNAVKLDGEKQQYVRLDDNITEKLTGNYTISVDFMPETDTSFARVFDLGSGTDNFMYFTANGGVPKFRFKNDDLYSDGVQFNVGKWNNATITKEGTNAKLYVNGEIAATSTTFMNDLSLLGKTDKNYLGKSQYEHDAYFTGMIDNFEIYNYAVSERDIKMNLTDGEVQVVSGYKDKDGNEIIDYRIGEDFISYADIKNYTPNSIKAVLTVVMYDKYEQLIGTENIEKRIESGASETLGINISRSDVYSVKTYIYTDIGGLQNINSLKFTVDKNKQQPLPEDSMETTIGVHDPSIFKDPKSGMYYVYSTGMIDIFKSEDLIHWTKSVNTLPELPQCVYDTYKHDKKTEYSNIWAPDMFYDESDPDTPYHLTCSYSDAFGKNNSSIILFKSDSPEGAWENGEIIFTSKSDDSELGKVNAIDSNICVDRETGKKYMVYGSFWQGIHIKELNEDGTVKDPTTVGRRIMSRYRGIGGPEGPYIIYNENTGYYYLFASYDNLSETYNIRVARSKSITGPYVDHNGNSVDRFDDDESKANDIYGYKLTGSYQFPNGTTNYGPGHNSVLHDGSDWYLVHHMRNVKNGYATLNVREMMWNKDGWPVVMPERYNDNGMNTAVFSDLIGEWDYISIGDNTNAMLTSEKLFLNYDGTAKLGEKEGGWTATFGSGLIANKTTDIEIEFEDEEINARVKSVWDSDNNRPTIVFTGTNEDNVQKWAKKAVKTVVYK